jgi:hypothetical protein
MRCITTAECEHKVKNLNLKIEGVFLRRINGKAPATLDFTIQDSTRRQALVVNELFSAFSDDTSEWLLWVLDWDLWPNEEYPELWNEIREHHGEHRWLIDARGHLFEQNEKGLARGMMRLAMLFGWTAFLIPDPASFVVFIDSDELMSIQAADGSSISDLAARVKDLWAKPL